MFSLYCRVSLYAWVKVEKLAWIQIHQFILKILVFFFIDKLVNWVCHFCIFERRYLNLPALSQALIQILFVGLLALSLLKEVDGFPKKTGSKERGNQKTVLFFDISVN